MPRTIDDIPGQPGVSIVVAESRSELTERKIRPMRILTLAYGDRLRDVVSARVIIGPDGKKLTPEESAKQTADNMKALQLTRDDWATILEMQDQSILTYLISWSLDRPLPQTFDDLIDLPVDLYEQLQQIMAGVAAKDMVANGFTVDSIEDDTSPTGASDD